MIEELRSKTIIPREYSTTSNPETDLEKESLGKISKEVGISKPTLTF